MKVKSEENHTQAHLFRKTSLENIESARSRPAGHAEDVAEAIERKGWAFLKVSGKSMFPWIREEDIVFLRRERLEHIARGDVIVFEKNSILCVHRVLSAHRTVAGGNRNLSVTTKGDAAGERDEPVREDEFRGRVEFVYRRNREIGIASGWRKYFGKLLALVSPATRWWRPAASALNRRVAQCEPLAAPKIELPRPSEHSAD